MASATRFEFRRAAWSSQSVHRKAAASLKSCCSNIWQHQTSGDAKHHRRLAHLCGSTSVTSEQRPAGTSHPHERIQEGPTPVESEKDDQIDWRQQWYAVHPVDSIPDDRPWAVQVLGRHLVVWKTASGAWSILDDSCPHRKVALSEGRLEADGTLACAYHGWRFDGDGKCKTIPQLNTLDAQRHDSVCNSPVSCATAFPTAEAGGLLFVWMVPGNEGFKQAAQVPVPNVMSSEEAEVEGVVLCPWYSRELPMSYEFLMENQSDPSHVPFAHHGVAGSRDNPVAPEYRVSFSHGKHGYVCGETKYVPHPSFDSNVRSILDFRDMPSTYTALRTAGANTDDPIETEEQLLSGFIETKVVLCPSPVTTTTSRIILRTEYHNKSVEQRKKLQKKPIWEHHIHTVSEILDGDICLLHDQTKRHLSNRLHHKDYYMPAATDLAVKLWWKQLDTHSKQGITYYPHDVDMGTEPVEEVMDRYNQHVKNCKYCRGAFSTIQKGSLAALCSTVLAAAAALLAACYKQSWLETLVCVLLSASSAYVNRRLKMLLQKFLSTPYVHQSR